MPRRRHLVALLAAAGAAAYVRGVHRFRDPVRFTPATAGAVLSPADGTVVLVRRVDLGTVTLPQGTPGQQAGAQTGQQLAEWIDGPTTRRDGWLIGVVISPLDVHFTYQPTDGLVIHTQHRDGGNVGLSLNKLLPIAARQPTDVLDNPGLRHNERYSYTLVGDLGSITVSQLALRHALHPRTYLQEGDEARAGNKATFLPEGGLVLLSLPDTLIPQVQLGQQVRGGETVIATQKERN